MQLVVGESVLIDETLSEYESLRVFFEVAGERGHSAPSIVVDERGAAVTHPDYVDRMGVAHLKAGAWAFCRRPAAEALGLPSGTDWIRDHCFHLMFTEGSPYLSRPYLHDQPYIQRFGDERPLPLAPICTAGPVAWNNEGSRICVMEERLGHVADNTGMAGHVLWEYQTHLGRRRRVAGFPASMKLAFNELSYSADDRWIHLCEGALGRNYLIRVADGLVVTLPFTFAAAAWNPRNGPSAMIVMIPDPDSGRLVIYDYDLAANVLEHRSDLESPTGLLLRVRELSMSADGRTALVSAPVGASGIEQGARGGVHVAAVIDIDDGSIEPVLPVRFRTRSAQRRHTSPRWCEERSKEGQASLVVAEQLLQHASVTTCDPDSPAIEQDLVGRWAKAIDGITTAWSRGRAPRTRFADECLQYALGCYQLDKKAAEATVSGLRQVAKRDPFARTVIRSVEVYRDRDWHPSAPLARMDPLQASGQPDEADAAARASQHQRAEILAPALGRIVAARSLAEARSAAGELLRAASTASSAVGTWQALAEASTEALAMRDYQFAAKAGLGTAFWHAFFRPALATSGLSQVPEDDLLPLLLNCFEACTHLPERTVVGSDAQSIYDVEDTRNRCQRALQSLPLAEYLITTPRPRLTIGSRGSLAPDPADEGTEKAEATVTSKKRVFVSYVREDSGSVDRLAAELTAHGFDVWLTGPT